MLAQQWHLPLLKSYQKGTKLLDRSQNQQNIFAIEDAISNIVQNTNQPI